LEAQEQTMVEALRDGLREEMQRDDRVILMGEDIGVAGGIFQATEGLRREFGRARVWDMPLAESGIVGISIGAALGGFRPVAEIQFADFMFAAMHQIVNEAAKMRYRSRGEWTCPIVIRAPFGGGVGGGPDHSQNVEAFFAHVPGLKVVIPATPADIKGLIKAAIRDEDPVIFLEPKRLYREGVSAVPAGDYVVPLGTAIVRREGNDVSIITYGAMVHESLEAAEALSGEGIDIEIVDVRTLQPLDFDTISASVRKTNHAIVFHEDGRFAGFGAEIAAFIAESCFEDLDGPVMRIGAVDLPIPASPVLEQAVLPNARTLIDAVHHLAAY
jgi:2-oxoisovalerate dehydrogenase E1 component beta subunit